jgi:hypothetical protein
VSGCQYPVWEPTPKRTSDCQEPATHAARLGATGRWLRLCPQHRGRRPDAVRLEEVPEL